jgi:hypothetical protein
VRVRDWRAMAIASTIDSLIVAIGIRGLKANAPDLMNPLARSLYGIGDGLHHVR